ncbi:MAG: FAD:protein FMN transferase [candidate division SR1 bacterium]|nr:FAD:protein FMN transferase [candidate division SR1 bacterium]
MLIDGVKGVGTYWWFQIYDGNESSEYYQNIIIQEIQRFERAYSRFLTDSQISLLNRHRELVNPSVELLELLAIGKEFYNKTLGLFNPAIGHILENRGYDTNYSFQNKGQLERVSSFDDLLYVDLHKVELSGQGNIDFGGYGKGYLVDKLAKIFCEKLDLNHFMINGGGDIYVAGDTSHEIILEHPFAPGYELGRIDLQNQALGCSSNRRRTWKDSKTGEEFGHILNPQNTDSKADFGSFVIAKDTLTADIMATVVCLLGDNQEKIYDLQKQINFEFVVVRLDLTMLVSDGFPGINA